MIARAAEGSVRDALSLLDQAIALADGRWRGRRAVRPCSASPTGSRSSSCSACCFGVRAAEAVDRFGELHGLGADPLALVRTLLEVCHAVSRLKVRPEAAGALGLAGELATVAQATPRRRRWPSSARAWQMLLRGVDEVRMAPDGARRPRCCCCASPA